MSAPLGNKYAEGLDNSGRPPIYDEPIKLYERITEYFNSCIPPDDDEETKHSFITITGLCLYCGFESRQSFYAYEQKQEFSYIIKRARLVIENAYELGLQGRTPTGAIFALKNMGWFDRQELTGAEGKDLTPTIIAFKDFTKNE